MKGILNTNMENDSSLRRFITEIELTKLPPFNLIDFAVYERARDLYQYEISGRELIRMTQSELMKLSDAGKFICVKVDVDMACGIIETETMKIFSTTRKLYEMSKGA